MKLLPLTKRFLLGLAALAVSSTLWSAKAPEPANYGAVPVIRLPLTHWTAVARQRGWLDEAFAPFGSKVELVEQSTSAAVGSEAAQLDRGRLHFASRMMYPAAIHKINGIDADIIWMSGVSNLHKLPIIALADSPLKSILDLEGKTLGTSRVSCGWTSPFEALEVCGISLDTDVKQGKVRYQNFSSSTALTSALLAGRIDATATHVALGGWAALYSKGTVKVIGRSAENGVYLNDAGRTSYFAMEGFAKKHPELVQAFLRVRLKAIAWVQANPDLAAIIVSRDLRLPLEIAKFQITDASAIEFMEGEPDAARARQAIRNFQKWYRDHGDDILSRRTLSNAQIDEFVDGRFFQGGEYSVY